MEDPVGIACGVCDTLAPMGGAWCPSCGNNLSFFSLTGRASIPGAGSMPQSGTVPLSPEPTEEPEILIDVGMTAPVGFPAPDAASAGALEEAVEQARYYICAECSSPVPPGHKFCGGCGCTVPDEALERKVEYFGTMQAPGKARLILIRGTDGTDGLSYLLQGTEHVAGRTSAQIPFPNDSWINDRHANFIYRGEKLVIRDEGSINGVYVRVKGSVPLSPGDYFLCGEQVFRVESTPRDTSGPEPDQTYFYSSPKRPTPFRIVQVLRGGADGMVYCARDNNVHVGREDNEMNFPDDIYMSGRHSRIEMTADGAYTLHDVGSRNGTYVRIREERELAHGDYLFIGQQLLRVEQTA